MPVVMKTAADVPHRIFGKHISTTTTFTTAVN